MEIRRSVQLKVMFVVLYPRCTPLVHLPCAPRAIRGGVDILARLGRLRRIRRE